MANPLNPKHQAPRFRWGFLAPRFWPTWLLLAILGLIAQLPLRLNLSMGRGLGWLFYHLAKRRRQIAATNIRLCFPELDSQAQAKMLRNIISNVGISFFETAMSLWGPGWRLRRCYSITGLEHIERAQAQGQGVLLLCSHMTTLDMAARLLGMNARIHIFYRQDPNPLLAYALVHTRERYYGDSIITVETRKLVNYLREGKIVWYAPDQDYGIKHSLFAPFFGITAATVPGTGRFARLGNARVIPFAHYRDERGHYRIELGPPLDNFPSGDDLADCTRVNQELERIIRAQPDQYLWVHKRFKTRPPGEPSLYQ